MPTPRSPSSRLRSSLPGIACLVLVLLLSSACVGDRGGPDPEEELVRYDDLVTHGSSLGDDGPRAPRVCDDRARFVRELESGDSIRFAIDLGRDPLLVVSGCRPEEAGGGELLISAAAGRAPPVEARLAFPEAPAWRRLEVDLSSLAGRSATVELTVSVPEGETLLVDAAYVRHRTSGPGPWLAAETEAAGGEAARAPQTRGSEQPAEPPRVLLISVDTLRADMVDLTGEEGRGGSSRTPSLARLAADGEVFTTHYAGGSWTKPSHATLLTGYPVSVHGADGESTLPATLPRLSGRLRDAGLAALGLVVDCVWLDPKIGFGVGFDEYRTVPWDTGQIARSTVNWLGAHRDEPFFFFFHTYDPHADFYRLPYESEGTSVEEVQRRFGVEDYGCREGHCAAELLARIGRGEVEPLPEEEEILEHLYQAGVADVDRELGALFQDLRDLGIYDDMLIIVTSDHGQMFLEHGATLHGTFWEPVVRVPLIVKWPRSEGRAGRVTEIPTSAVDVAATILATAGVDKGDLPGIDLRRPRERPVFVGHPDWHVVYQDGYKGVFHDDGPRRLYDPSGDAEETTDLQDREPEALGDLEERLRAFRRWSEVTRERVLAEEANSEQDLTEEERLRLRALGYLQ